ncbi:MAG: DUF3858 domain-containing protein [Nonlabens sp.]|uniref:DUF3858 domain-containing protein n=1 Tax=Nonlabens sp. TaxID=1888209 RepID=UPI003EF32715
MKNKLFLTFLLFVLGISMTMAQDNLLMSLTIPVDLKEGANTIIRKNDITLTINDRDEVIYEVDRIVTVFDENGYDNVDAIEAYDNSTIIKKMEAVIYNAFGKEIEVVKRKDFKDYSSVSGSTLYSDSRYLSLGYIPRSYPVTVHYTAEVKYKSTAFLPSWRPLESYGVSTESSSINVINETDINVRLKKENFDGYNIEEISPYHFQGTNIPAISYEEYAPTFSTFAPRLKIALEQFEMKGVEGINPDWNQFGKWMYDSLLQDVTELPEGVLAEVKELTKDAITDKEKAAIVYKYMQDRSRYISVQVGIGGWKPALAQEVHDLAYGDCKGLTNYTLAILRELGIPAYHAVIYGGRGIVDIDQDFSSTQGNHMILYMPQLDDEKNVWLECTSKTNPFGYIAGFTDDRDALVVTPEGGKIMHTTVYDTESNTQSTSAQIEIDAMGSLKAQVEITSAGWQYSFRDELAGMSKNDLFKRYKSQWGYMNGINIQEAQVQRDVDKVIVTESIAIQAENYGSQSGERLLFQPIVLNRRQSIPKRHRNRLRPVEIDRGYIDIDNYTITISPDLKVEALPEDYELNTPFGNYKVSVKSVDATTIKVFRELKINKGVFPSEQYKEFREFISQVVKHDKSRAVLAKI